MTHPAIGSWPDEAAGYEFHLVEQDLNPKGKVCGTSHDIHATVAKIGMP